MIVFALVVQDAVAVALFVAGLAKSAQLGLFRDAVANYQIVPVRLVSSVAWGVPIAEILIGALLASAAMRPVGLVGAAAVLTVFAIAMAINLVRGRRIDCGCGGSRQSRDISWWLVLRNVSLVGLLVLSGFVTVGNLRSFLDTRLPALLAAVGLVMAVSACRVAVIIWRHPSMSRLPTQAVLS